MKREVVVVVGLGRAIPRPDKCSGGKSVKKKKKKKGEEKKKKRKKNRKGFSRTGGVKRQKLGREGSNLTPQ